MGCCGAAARLRPRRAAARRPPKEDGEATRLILGVAPETLERVEAPRLLLEDVEDDVAVVHQDPARRLEPLDGERRAELLGDRVGDGAGLAVGAGRREHEVVRHRRQLGQVEDEDGGGLAVERGGQTLADLFRGGELGHQRRVTPDL